MPESCWLPTENILWFSLRNNCISSGELQSWHCGVTLDNSVSWCWERLRAGGERDDREWDGWMASPTQCTWVWVGSRSWWWTGRPGVPQSMGSQRVRHDSTEWLNWTELILCKKCTILVSDVDNGGAMYVWGQEVYGKSLYFPFNFIKT